MISLRHKFTMAAIKLLKLNQLIPKQIAKGQPSPVSPSAKQTSCHHIEKHEFEGRPVWHIRPQSKGAENAPLGRVYMLHGGAFILGLQPIYFSFYGHLADVTGYEIIAPDYPLPPSDTVDAITGWTLRHFSAIASADTDAPLVLAGDSAGGNLALLTAQQIKTPLKALVLISPWADLTMTDTAFDICKTEPLIEVNSLREAARIYADQRALYDPVVSPLYGPMAGLPPVHIFSGEHDILHPDIIRLRDALSGQGAQVHFDSRAGLTHDYLLFPTPEGRAALRRIADIIKA